MLNRESCDNSVLFTAPPRPPLQSVERVRQTASKSPLHRMERGFRGEVNPTDFS